MSRPERSLEFGFSNERRGAVDQAKDYITTLIDLRRVRPGSRLPPASALAEAIGVSRPAVLQALKILATQGRVIVRTGRGGTWVATNEPENLDSRIARAWENRERIVQMAHLREILEAGVARLVAVRGMDRATLQAARRMVEEMAVHPGTDIEGYRAIDTDFHILIGRAVGMPLIESHITMCRREVAAAFDVMKVPPGRKKSSDDEHEAILDAIERRDADEAARLARLHVASTTALLEKVLGPLDAPGPTKKKGRS